MLSATTLISILTLTANLEATLANGYVTKGTVCTFTASDVGAYACCSDTARCQCQIVPGGQGEVYYAWVEEKTCKDGKICDYQQKKYDCYAKPK